jgi:predicted permease
VSERFAFSDGVDDFVSDVRYVFRTLRRNSGVSLIIVLVLAVAVGANAAMYGVIDRLLLRGPEHVVGSRQLYRLFGETKTADGPQIRSRFGYAAYTTLRSHSRALRRVAAYRDPREATIRSAERTERATVAQVTWDFFPLLGVRPQTGRFFSDDEDRVPSSVPLIVLSDALFRRLFAGDTGSLGKTISLYGRGYTVIGVTPRGFTGADLTPVDAWIPLLNGPVQNWPADWDGSWLHIVARLAPGVDHRLASEEVSDVYERHYAGASAVKRPVLTLGRLDFDDSGHEMPEARVSRWLMGVSFVVMLVATSNVSNLMLVRAMRRRREVAVMIAVGISSWRLWRLMVLEGLALSTAGCAVGLGLAYVGGSALRALLLPTLAWPSGPLNVRVFALASGLALFAGFVVSLAPAWQTRALALTSALKAGSEQVGNERSYTGPSLLFVQCALSVVLVIGAGLFGRSLERVRSLDLGFRHERVVTATAPWFQRSADAPRQAIERLRSTPGITHAAMAIGTPFGSTFGVSLTVPGLDSIPQLAGGGPYISAVSDEFFESLGARLVAGRFFDSTDRGGSERVVIVNEPMAAALWPGQNALGKCIHVFSQSHPCARIVGVVGEMRRRDLYGAHAMQYYVPLGQQVGIDGPTLLVSGTVSPKRLSPVVERVLRSVDSSATNLRVTPLRDAIDPLYRQWKLGAILFGVFGSLALGIACLGLYSVISYLVVQRRSEFGVRLALGASRTSIVGLVFRGSAPVVVGGLIAGLLLALALGDQIEPLLFQTSSRDVGVFATVIGGLLLTTVAATLLPASVAAAVDPTIALQAD